MLAKDLAAKLLETPELEVVVWHGDTRSMATVCVHPQEDEVIVHQDQLRIKIAHAKSN